MIRFQLARSLAIAVACVVCLPVGGFAAEPAPPDAVVPRDAAPVDPPQPVDAAKTPEQHQQALASLYGKLAAETSDVDATAIRGEIRQLWRQTGSATIDLLLARDAEAAAAHNEAVRRQLLEAAAKLAPDIAEVWNRRAGLDFTDQRYEDAIADLGHALAIDPRHFDALEALAGILKDTGRDDLALKAYRRLKAINPAADNLQGAIDELARKVEGQRI